LKETGSGKGRRDDGQTNELDLMMTYELDSGQIATHRPTMRLDG